MNTAGILVVYSEAFADTAIRVFAQLVRRIDPNAVLVVVNNNNRLRLKSYDGVTVLQGSNFLHEFGAWQAGLDHLRSLQESSFLQAVIFANDTFCHYRPMGALEQAAFALGARLCRRSRAPQACGELAPTPNRNSYEFLGVRLREWIATYLFVLNRAALEGIGWAMHSAKENVERWVPGGLDEEGFFAADMDPILKHHMTAWLFGRSTLPAWRRSEPLTLANRDMMLGKAHMLVCEQELTVRLLQCGARIRSVLHMPLIYLVKNFLLRV